MSQLTKFPGFINDKMLGMIVSWTFDKIGAVRHKSINLIEELFKTYGSTWAENKLIPKILAIQNSPNYLQRQLILIIIEKVIKHSTT
jgi:hypothetical protein